MSKKLTDHQIDVWAATEARYRPAADPAEKADTRSGMRALTIFLVIAFPALLTGVIALVRYFLKT